MRLSEEEIKYIRDVIKRYDNNSEIYIFGSRLDDSKKGGDIDIMVVSKVINFEKILDIKAELYDKLGFRKIDLIVSKGYAEESQNFKKKYILRGSEN